MYEEVWEIGMATRYVVLVNDNMDQWSVWESKGNLGSEKECICELGNKVDREEIGVKDVWCMTIESLPVEAHWPYPSAHF
jgi:hypothetical protein